MAADGWLEEFDCAFAWIAGRFARVEPRRRARKFLLGLLSDVETRSCWQLAEQAGDLTPHGMQRLLGETAWDADAGATTCAGTWSTNWAIRVGCSCSMAPVT